VEKGEKWGMGKEKGTGRIRSGTWGKYFFREKESETGRKESGMEKRVRLGKRAGQPT
jgi:hypothetical protein